jgi:hypothetical protein
MMKFDGNLYWESEDKKNVMVTLNHLKFENTSGRIPSISFPSNTFIPKYFYS